MSSSSKEKVLDQSVVVGLEEEESRKLYPSDVFDEESSCVRLRHGIRVGELLDRNESVVVEPIIDESRFDEEGNNNYFDDKLSVEELERRLNLSEFAPNHVDDAHEDDDDNFQLAAKRMQSVTADGGIVKRIVRPAGPQVSVMPDFATVTIHYSIFISGQDEPVDSTELRAIPERYSIPDGGLLPGLEMAVTTMKKGERSHFVLQPEYYMGTHGCMPRVPPNTPVLAKIELIDVVQASGAESMLSGVGGGHKEQFGSREVKTSLSFEHQSGNKAFKENQFFEAHRHYFLAIRLLESVTVKDEKEEREHQRLLLKLCLNRAQCSIKLGEPKRACLDLQKALEIEPRNVKALYRMGRAKRMLTNFDDALKYLERARSIEPLNVDIGQEISSLRDWLQEQKEQQKKTYANMFALMPKNSGEEPEQVEKQESEDKEPELSAEEQEFKETMRVKIETFLKSDSKERYFYPALDSNCTRLISITQQLAKEMGREYEWAVITLDGRPQRKLRIVKHEA